MVDKTLVREEFSKIKEEFPNLPVGLILASCQAETSFDQDQFYRHEPVYWRQYMQKDKDFWTALYNFQYSKAGEEAATEEDISNKYAASYGIMQVMYDIAVDVYLKDIVGNKSLYSAMDDFRRNNSISEDIFLELDTPEDLNSIENGLWYGCYELSDKMKEVYSTISGIADKGQKIPKLQDFLAGKEKITFVGKKIEPMDFYKFCLVAYQAGPALVKKLLGIMRAERTFATWADMESYVSRAKSEETAGQIKRHIKRAFEGANPDDFKF